MLRILPPFLAEPRKRLMKSPRGIYLRDSGILHTLLDIESFNDLLGIPFGVLLEGWVMRMCSGSFLAGGVFLSHRRGRELDLILEKEGRASPLNASYRGF